MTRRPSREVLASQSLRMTIDSIAAGGDGVARAGGLVVFVPRTAPGDVATINATTQGRMARGVVQEIETPSPARVEPPCPHYVKDKCGGCQIQHMSYAAQLAAKRLIVADAFDRIAKRRVDVPDVAPSVDEWRYRRKLTLTMRLDGDAWIAGLHPYDDPVSIFGLHDCLITDERVLTTWREVLAAAKDLPDSRELRGAVQLTAEGPTLVLEGGAQWPTRDRFFAATPSLIAVWWVRTGGTRRLMLDRRKNAEPGASFAQVNSAMGALLHGFVVERALAAKPRSVVDAYAGTGDTAVRIANAGVRVHAIELDADAARWCGERLPSTSRAVRGRVEDELPNALPADVVILNPPRTGVDERVTATLREVNPKPRSIVYVSCNPATLARDVARLEGYRVSTVQSFDMFPQTAHVETVCELVPVAA